MTTSPSGLCPHLLHHSLLPDQQRLLLPPLHLIPPPLEKPPYPLLFFYYNGRATRRTYFLRIDRAFATSQAKRPGRILLALHPFNFFFGTSNRIPSSSSNQADDAQSTHSLLFPAPAPRQIALPQLASPERRRNPNPARPLDKTFISHGSN